jgi:hypothetical protein
MLVEPSCSVGRELLTQILASRQFARAGLLKNVLQYLCERSWQPGTRAPKEYEIAVAAMGRSASFDPAGNPVVRVTISQIRRRLESFFQSEGAHLPYRLEIVRGRYEVRVIGHPSRAAGVSIGPLQKFWSGFRNNASRVIVYTEPRSFRIHEGCSARNSLDQGGSRRDLLSCVPALCGAGLEPHCRHLSASHYLSTGEVRCLLSLSTCFGELGLAADFRIWQHLAERELCRHDVILLGSPRTNALLDGLQQGLPLQVTATSVALPGQRSFPDQRLTSASGDVLLCWAVVTRFRHPATGRTVLLISANQDAAIEGAGRVLTSDNSLATLLAKLEAEAGDAEEGFQALLEVRAGQGQGALERVPIAQIAMLRGLRKAPRRRVQGRPCELVGAAL